MVEIYTDGSCTNNGVIEKSYGAYSFIIVENESIIYEYVKYEKNITNQIMELSAIKNALCFIVENNYDKNVTIFTDSQYSINVITGIWKAKVNLNIIRDIVSIIDNNNLNIIFNWVKGHSSNKYNNYCDELCTKEVNKQGLKSFEEMKYNVAK